MVRITGVHNFHSLFHLYLCVLGGARIRCFFFCFSHYLLLSLPTINLFIVPFCQFVYFVIAGDRCFFLYFSSKHHFSFVRLNGMALTAWLSHLPSLAGNLVLKKPKTLVHMHLQMYFTLNRMNQNININIMKR